MASRTGILLLLALVVAVGSVSYLLLGDGLGDESSALDRGSEARGPDGELLDAGGPGLSGRTGARSAEEIAAERAAREAARTRPTLPRPESVFGRVTDAGDRPVANATVKLMIATHADRTWGVPDPEPLATAVTDADGRYLVGPAPGGRLRIRAEADGYAPTLRDVKRRGYRVDLILDRGGALDVTVKDAEGKPLPGARVLFQTDRVVSDDVADENGHVFFPGLPTGTGSLFASAEGHAGIQQDDVGIKPGSREQRTVVLGKPLVVEGRVLDQETEQPVEGARLTLRFPRMPWVARQGVVTSDEDGRFETEVPLPVGQSMDLGVEATGYATMRAWYQATDAGDGRMTLELKLVGGAGKVRGEVVDARGIPQAGAKVTYMSGRTEQEAPETTTGADGSFTLPPTPWSTRPGSQVQVVGISRAGAVGIAFAQLAKENEPTKPITIRLSATGTVRGRVNDAGGEPLPGALVSLAVDWGLTMQRARSRPGGGQPWQVVRLVQDPRYVRLDEITDDAGDFVIPGVPTATYRVSASFGLDTVTAGEPVHVEGGATVTRNVELGEGASIEGFVGDAEGNPVPGARVTAYPEQTRGGTGSTSQITARSQSDGHFALHGASDGVYTLRAWAAGFESKSERGISAGQGGITLTMTALGWIEGVVSYQGRPHQGTFTVSAKNVRKDGIPSNGPPGRSRFGRGGSTENTFHTDDGRFTLRNLTAGEYDISARTPDGLIAAGGRRVRVADGLGSRAALDLVGGAVLTGTLVDDLSGEPISGAQVQLRGAPGTEGPPTTARARTDAEGKFIARGLATGRYVVYVHPPSGISFHQAIDVRAGESSILNLRERACGAIQIYVRDTAGRPVEASTPHVKSEAGPEVWPSWQAMRRRGVNVAGGGRSSVLRTDENGANLRPLVPPGRYQVTADKQGMTTVEPRWIDVSSGRTTEVEVILRGAGEDPGAPVTPPR